MTYVRYEPKGRIAHIVLDRPEKLNAFTDESMYDFQRALFEFDDDDDVWLAIIHGEGRAFCSGADMHKLMGRPQEEIKKLGGVFGERGASLGAAFLGLRRFKPLIAAVHGWACGAGLKLSMYCDMIVVDETAKFQVTEIPRGVDAQPFWLLLQDRVNSTFADDVCLTGRTWSGQEAVKSGMATRLAPAGEHVKVAEELAAAVLGNPPLAVREICKARRVRVEQLELTGRMVSKQTVLNKTWDHRESVDAFKEKRVPQYRGE